MTMTEAKLFEMLGRAHAQTSLLNEALIKAQQRIAELEARAADDAVADSGQAKH
ncbi:MAG: hypothetical protein AB7S99_00645 [Pseudodonghicola sp.]